MYNLVSAFIGVLITVMILFNGVLSQYIGNYSSTLIIHMLGLISVGVILLATRTKMRFVKELPLYIYCGGFVGVFVILFNNISFTYLGASITLALGLFGQSVASIIIDHFGLLGMKINKFRKKKLLGLLIIAAGIVIMTVF